MLRTVKVQREFDRRLSPGAALPAEREKSRSLASLVMTTFEKLRDGRLLR